MYNQHTRGMETTWHRSLVERGGRKAFVTDKGLAHQKKGGKKNARKNADIHECKEKDSSK